MSIYYISDLHFLHERSLGLNRRPFKDVDEMHKVIIDKWNNKVNEDDRVYILGDVAFARNLRQLDEAMELIKQLNGTKILVQGNHDGKAVRKESFRELFEDVSIYMDIVDDGRRVILMHYPIEDWAGRDRGSYHLHGHVHDGNSISNIERRFNCCVDVRGFEPLSLDELIANNI